MSSGWWLVPPVQPARELLGSSCPLPLLHLLPLRGVKQGFWGPCRL